MEAAWICLSYRPGFNQHQASETLGQRHRGEHVCLEARQFLDFKLDAGQAEQCRFAADRVYKNVQVAAFRVIAMNDRAKHAGVGRVIGKDDAPDVCTVLLQRKGWLHEVGGLNLAGSSKCTAKPIPLKSLN